MKVIMPSVECLWSTYEQFVVCGSLAVALLIVNSARRKADRCNLNLPFVNAPTWDFSPSWASNISTLAGVIGVTVANTIVTDFKPFAQIAVKGAYNVTSVLMGAIIIAAPSAYSLLQIHQDKQMVGSVRGFLAACVLTLWGTLAQVLLQTAFLFGFILQKVESRAALLLVPLLLVFGIVVLIPYSMNSILVALKQGTTPASAKERLQSVPVDGVGTWPLL